MVIHTRTHTHTHTHTQYIYTGVQDAEAEGGNAHRKAYSVEEWRSLLAVRFVVPLPRVLHILYSIYSIYTIYSIYSSWFLFHMHVMWCRCACM